MAEKQTTTTMEKLFVQIFERKRWIVDQVHHHSRLFDHHLTSTLLIDAIPPPPWLLPHPFPVGAESNKEELISGLLFPYPQASLPYSSTHPSVSHRLNFASDAELLQGFYGDARSTHRKLETGADTTVLPEVVSSRKCAPGCASNPPLSPLAHECVSNDAPEPMPTPADVVKSLGEQNEAVVPDSYHSIEQSLARIQRSRSRQKDIELRSSTKASRTILHHEGNAADNASTVMDTGSVRPLIDHKDDMELVVPSGNDCDVLAVEEDRNVDFQSQDEALRISGVRGDETLVSGLQPLSVSESVKSESSHSIAGNSDSQVSASVVKHNSRASGLVQFSSVSDDAGEKRKQADNSIYSTEPHREIEFPELAVSSGVNCEAELSIEEAIHVNSTEQPHERSKFREAETELCQIPEKLNGGRPSGLSESGDIGSLNSQVKNTGGMPLQLQQVDGSGGQLIQPLKQGILFSSGQPSSTAFHRMAFGQPSTIADQRDVISCNRYGAHSKSIDTDAGKMQCISDKPSRRFSAHIQSDSENDHLKLDAEILVSRSSTDRAVHVKPKQLNFNYLAGQTNSLNKLEGTAFKITVQEEVPSDCQIKSLDQENENGQCLLFPNEGEPDDGSSNGISEVAELVCDAAEAGKSLSTEFSSGRETDKSQPVAVTASPSSFFPSSHRDYSAKSHQMDVPTPKEIIIAYEGDPVSSNASCNLVDSDDQILEDYSVEGFRFTPMELDTEGDPGPSLQTGMLLENPADPLISLSAETEVTDPLGHVLDQSKASVEENRDHPHPEDHISNGDAEQSASSEGPMDGRMSHLEESYEPSSHLTSSPFLQLESTNADHDMPVFEGFTMPSKEENLCLPKGQSSFEKLDLRDPIVERACFIEQLCKSTCMDTPFSYSSTADKLQKVSNLYQSVPNGLLSFSDTLPFSGSGKGRKPYSSPVGKLWDRMASSSGSSKKKASLNPELPCISEENEIADEVTATSGKDVSLPVITSSAKRKPLDDITEDPNLHISVSELENHRCSLESVNTEVSFSGTNKRYKQENGMRRKSKMRPTNNIRDSKPLASSVRVAKMPVEPPHNSASKRNTSLKKDGLNILEKEVKRGNIVCNVNSFIPLVQQKQAVKPATGKRDVKVKALEAADAARRQLEKREVERKMKKEAMQLERARIEQENKRQLELQLKKKEEDRKKKEAEIAARKRLREEDEKREKERKRKRVEEARRQQEEQKGKARLKKDDKGTKTKAMIPGETRDAGPKKSENVADFVQSLHAAAESGSLVPETPRDCRDNSKATSFFSQGYVRAAVGDIQEQSYEISPFQCSDDEYNEDDDDKPKKFIPSWASKNKLAQAIAAQDKVDPNLILPPESFCSIEQVVLPRGMKLR